MLLMVDLMIISNYFFNLNARLKIGCVADVIEFSWVIHWGLITTVKKYTIKISLFNCWG